jgi:exopolysaccharide/PEP-CTERM locus tyrosine autokinase
MGKFTDALEKHKKEKTIKVERLDTKPDAAVFRGLESDYAKEFCSLHECDPKLVVLDAPDSLDSENFKILRSQILFSRNRERPRTILVTSSFPGEGKTFVSCNLAVSIAMGIDEYVLLVDCDCRRPGIHKMFGYENKEGLHEYLTGQKELPELIIGTEIKKLSLLPAGDVPPNPAELISSSTMGALVKELKDRYQDRFIVFDSTPSQVTSEANVLAKYVDGVIFVVLAQKSPSPAIQKAVNEIGREKILGLVFNGYSQAYKNYHKYYKKYYK